MLVLIYHLLQHIQINDPLVGELGSLSFGGFLGYSIGYVLKKVFKIVLIIIGAIFIVFQIFNHFDLLIVNWSKIKCFAGNLQTHNLNEIISILSANLSTSSGFLAGFLIGFKKG